MYRRVDLYMCIHIYMYPYTNTWNSSMCMCNNCKDVLLDVHPLDPLCTKDLLGDSGPSCLFLRIILNQANSWSMISNKAPSQNSEGHPSLCSRNKLMLCHAHIPSVGIPFPSYFLTP